MEKNNIDRNNKINLFNNIENKKKIQENKNNAAIKRILDSSYYRSQSGKPKYNERIHFSKLLKDENEKSESKRGVLYYQENENNPSLEKITERFNLINDNGKLYDLDTTINIPKLETKEKDNYDDDDLLNFNKLKQDISEAKNLFFSKKIQRRENTRQYYPVKIRTVYLSYENSDIEDQYKYLAAVLRLSIEEFHSMKNIYELLIKNPIEMKGGASIAQPVKSLKKLKKPKLKKLEDESKADDGEVKADDGEVKADDGDVKANDDAAADDAGATDVDAKKADDAAADGEVKAKDNEGDDADEKFADDDDENDDENTQDGFLQKRIKKLVNNMFSSKSVEQKNREKIFKKRKKITEYIYNKCSGEGTEKDKIICYIFERLNFKINDLNTNIKISNEYKNYIKNLYEALDNIKGEKLKDKFTNKKDNDLIYDDFSIFIVLYRLILQKSFWIFFPKKNEPFIKYVCERILELIDYKSHTVIILNDNIKKEYKSSENLINDNIKNILNYYILGPSTGDNKIKLKEIYYIDKKNFSDRLIDIIKEENNINTNNDLYNLNEIKIPYQVIDHKETKNYYNDYNSLITDSFIQNIKNFFNDVNNKIDRFIIIISCLSFNIIQYLLVAIFYTIYNSTKENKTSFEKYLSEIDLFPFVVGGKKNNNFNYIINLFKNNVNLMTEHFDGLSNDEYKKFLQFVWNEYKVIKKIPELDPMPTPDPEHPSIPEKKGFYDKDFDTTETKATDKLWNFYVSSKKAGTAALKTTGDILESGAKATEAVLKTTGNVLDRGARAIERRINNVNTIINSRK